MFHLYFCLVENGEKTFYSQGLKYNIPKKDEYFIVFGEVYVATEVCLAYAYEEAYVVGTRVDKCHIQGFVPDAILETLRNNHG